MNRGTKNPARLVPDGGCDAVVPGGANPPGSRNQKFQCRPAVTWWLVRLTGVGSVLRA